MSKALHVLRVRREIARSVAYQVGNDLRDALPAFSFGASRLGAALLPTLRRALVFENFVVRAIEHLWWLWHVRSRSEGAAPSRPSSRLTARAGGRPSPSRCRSGEGLARPARGGRSLTASRFRPTPGRRYIDLLADLLLVRRLPPFHANTGKRLVKSPKVYVRDSGILHALLGIKDHNALAGHPVVGTSWEGFVIENLLAAAPERTLASFYRTSAGAEIDLVLDLPKGERWAVEIKRGLTVKPEKGFYVACEDLQPARRFVVYSGDMRFPVSADLEAIGVRELAEVIANAG